MPNRREPQRNNQRIEDLLESRPIPFMGGRPDRGVAVDTDDILNLLIALNTSSTLEEFLEKV